MSSKRFVVFIGLFVFWGEKRRNRNSHTTTNLAHNQKTVEAELQGELPFVMSHLFTVRDGVIFDVFGDDTDLLKVQDTSSHGCALFRDPINPAGALSVMPKALVAQMVQRAWRGARSWLQVVTSQVQYETTPLPFGVPALVPVDDSDTLGSFWAKAMDVLCIPSEVQSTLRPAYKVRHFFFYQRLSM